MGSTLRWVTWTIIYQSSVLIIGAIRWELACIPALSWLELSAERCHVTVCLAITSQLQTSLNQEARNVASTFHQPPKSKLWEIYWTPSKVFHYCSWLTKISDFRFKFTDRAPSCLPKEYNAPEGETCYFLDGYTHAGKDDSLDTQEHIDAAMQQINSELKNIVG